MGSAEKNVVWVTGGAGYIGSNVIRCLLKQKMFPIIIDDFSTGSRRLVPANVPFVNHSICGNQAELKDRLTEMVEKFGKPLALGHLAARTNVKWCEEHPVEAYNANVVGTYNIVHLAKQFDCNQVVFASSAAVYGDLGKKPAETSNEDLEPVGVYGRTKLDAEQMLSSYFKTNPLTAAVRMFNVSGAGVNEVFNGSPRGRPDPFNTALLPRMVRSFLGGHQILMKTKQEFFLDYSPVRDFIHVTNVAESLTRLLTVKFTGNWGSDLLRLNLGRGMPVKIHDLLQLTQFGKQELSERVIYSPLSKDEIFYSVAGGHNTAGRTQRTLAQMWADEVRWQKSKLYRLIKNDMSKET